MTEEQREPVIHQSTETRLIGINEHILKFPQAHPESMPPPSGQESVWRMFDTNNGNRIIVTQSGEKMLKAAISSEKMESLARTLHELMKKGRELTKEDPFDYVFGYFPSREKLGGGGEGVAYRIKGTNIVIKIRINHTLPAEQYLERAEAMRMAINLQKLEDIAVVPIYCMVFPMKLSEKNTDAYFPDEGDTVDCVFMPYVEGPTVAQAIEQASTQAEADAILEEYQESAATMSRIARDNVSRSIIPLGHEGGKRRGEVVPMLDLAVENCVVQIDPITGKRRFVYYDYTA